MCIRQVVSVSEFRWGGTLQNFQRLVFGVFNLPTHPQYVAQALALHVVFLTNFQYTLLDPLYWHIDCNVWRFFRAVLQVQVRFFLCK